MFNCMNTFRIQDYEEKLINSQNVHVLKFQYVSMVKLKVQANSHIQLDQRELNMIKNYDYQQSHLETGKADLLYQL